MPSDDKMELDKDEEQEIEPRSPFDEEFPNNYNYLEDETDGDFHHSRMPHESDESGSDYEETEKEAQCRCIGWSKCRVASATPTIEEQDAEDDQDFDQIALRMPPSPPRIKFHQKGKWKAMPTEIHDRNGDHNSDSPQHERQMKKKAGPSCKADHQLTVQRMNHLFDVEDDDKLMGREYSSGPIPSAVKEAAYSAHNKFIQKLEDLANAWDAFQRWYPAQVKKKPADVSIQEWARHVGAEYCKEMATLKVTLRDKNPMQEDIEKHFQVQLAFYKESLENWLMEKKGDKKFTGVVSHILEPFICWSTQVSEEYGIHIFSFAVETSNDSCSSVTWGGSSEYKYLCDRHAMVIKTQLHDYEGLFKVAEMQHQKLGQISLSSLIDTHKKPNENPCDHFRRVLGEFLRADLVTQQDNVQCIPSGSNCNLNHNNGQDGNLKAHRNPNVDNADSYDPANDDGLPKDQLPPSSPAHNYRRSGATSSHGNEGVARPYQNENNIYELEHQGHSMTRTHECAFGEHIHLNYPSRHAVASEISQTDGRYQ
ncbi:hypothetical protein BDZ97DRAFT_1926530 [Flammula alnicola]|nr:hypothetical protein BDZ97DRAFT_1926530 [Flammula alnicola]